MTGDEEIEAHLGAVFDELVDLVGEVKQAVWTASSPERRQAFDELKLFLGGQAAIVDDAEQRLGGRPSWVSSPTGHRARNIVAEAGGDPTRLVELLRRDLEAVIGDIRRRSAELDGEWRELLSGVADGLQAHVDAL